MSVSVASRVRNANSLEAIYLTKSSSTFGIDMRFHYQKRRWPPEHGNYHTIIEVFIGFVCLSTPRPFMGPRTPNVAGR